MTSVYFFDEQQHLLRIVNEKELVEVVQEKEITSNKEELLHDTLNVSTIYDEELKGASYMAVKESKDFYSLYRIVVDSEAENILSFVGIAFAPDELDSYVIKNISVKNVSIKSTLQKLLQETEWQIGHVDSGLPSVTADFSYLSIRDSLKELQTKGCEILFKYKIDGIGITEKWVEVYREIGIQGNQRFTYGDKALSIVKKQDRNEVYTSLIGRGRGEDVGDGKGKRAEFTTIEWKKSNGDPLDKPKGQNWLEFPEMTKQYGIPLKNGGMRKREKVITFDEVEEPKELLKQTYEALVNYSRPLTQFKTEVLGGDAIGNTVTIHHHERNYHYQTRIFKVKIDRLTGKVEAGLGDNITKSMSKAASDLKGNVASLEEKKMTFYDSEEISKWQDDIIRGAKGGSIKLMNGIETGKSDSREPYQMVWMNKDSLEASDHFLVANSEGIGFIDGKFNLDNFKTAWTIDGKFNADFIQAGTIRGRLIEGCEFRTLDDAFQIKILNGTIIFSDKKANKRLGSINATLSNGVVNGFAVTQQPGFIFSLNSGSKDKDGISNYVIQIPKESTMEDPKLNSRAEWKHKGDLHVTGKLTLEGELHIKGKLFLNGKEITGNGNGSGGNGGTGGGYPPEITTQTDKFAWDLWSYLVSNGYSQAAAAGILGNVQQETGGTMDPDTDQIDGPAYGLVQWDGSSYPLIGSPTWDGREYVKRLVGAAGITNDYKSTLAQAKLIDWCMYNGQWIGVVNPTGVDGFKGLTDPATAAYAFEMNFERPKNAHPERQGYAQEWYNKFKDLKPSTGAGKAGLDHLESLVGQYWGNGQCYAVPAEYSGFLGGCGLGAETQYGLSHVIGNTAAAADIGSSYDWAAVGWRVIFQPEYKDLVTGAIINWRRGGNIGGFNVDYTYGHTGVIRGLTAGGFQTYEQNIGKGQIIERYERTWVGSSEISSIVIPPK
nr:MULTISPECIES: phage tail spike protein [unclassified Enterococcus]